MKIIHILTVALLLCVQKGGAQTTDDYLNQGLSYLQSSNLVAANVSFASAVSLSPTNQKANALYGVTRLLVLPYQPAGSNFLTRLGVPATGRSVYNWTASLPSDTNGVLLAPVGVDASELAAMIRTNVLLTVIAAEANLALVTDTNFLLSLSSQDSPLGAVQVDYGDVLLLRAALQGAIYFGYTVNSFNLYAQFTALRSLYLSDGLNPGDILAQFPELFTFTTTNDMAAAKVAFANAANLYIQASSFIRARPINETRLFNYDVANANKESDFRRILAGLLLALDGAARLDVGQHLTVDLRPIFDGLHPWRSFLPQFYGADFILGSLDPTFEGVITGLDLSSEESFMAQHVPVVANFSSAGFVQGQFAIQLNVLPGHGYAIESSPDLVNWTLVSHQFATDSVITVAQSAGSDRCVFYRAREESNDRFANAYVITGLPANAFGSNEGATSEPGDPTNYFGQIFGFGAPVWWTWTATVSGPVGISARASRFNPVLGVFTGSTLANLVPVVNLASTSPEFDFQAIAGTTYFIAAESGYYLAAGTIQLSLVGPPPNDNFGNRTALTGATVSVNGCNILATEEPNEQYGGGHSVWYSWTAPASGSVAVSTTGAAYPFAAIFTGNDPSTLTQVGEGSSFDAVAGTTYQIQVDGYETGSFVLALSLFEGRYALLASSFPSEGGGIILQPAPDSNGMYAIGTSVTITAQPSSGFLFGGFTGSISTSGTMPQIAVVMNGSQRIYASFYPANDNFAQSKRLNGQTATISGSTDGASNELGEPGFGYQTVWYSWVAPASGTVTFWLEGAYRPQLNFFTGDVVTNLSPVSIFSYGESHGVASQTFDVVANTTYQIQIGGYCPSFNLLFELSPGFYALSDFSSPVQGGAVTANPAPSTNGLYAAGTMVTLQAQPAQGFVFVGWDGISSSSTKLAVNMNASQQHFALFHVANDAFAARTILTGNNISVIGSTVGAGSEVGETCVYCQTVWYSWTAPASGHVSLSLGDTGSGQLTVFTGNQMTTLVATPFVSTSMNGTTSNFSFDAVAGTVYQIQIDGLGGPFTLGLNFIPGFYALVESIVPGGTGSIIANPAPSTNGLYAAGTKVGLTAKPAPGLEFASWSGAATGTNATTSVVMNQSQFVQASFQIAPAYLGLIQPVLSKSGTSRATPDLQPRSTTH